METRKYFSYHSLVGIEGKITLENMTGFCDIRQEGIALRIKGSRTGDILLHRGESFCFESGGAVWLVRSPDSYTDPVQRFIAEQKLQQRLLFITDAPFDYVLTLGPPNPDGSRPNIGSNIEILGYYEEFEIIGSKKCAADGGYSVGRKIVGGSAAIISITTNRSNRLGNRLIERIIVRSTSNKEAVRVWLQQTLSQRLHM